MKDLRSFIDELKDAGELVTIDKELSVEYEAACVIKIFSESDNRAVFLSKAKDYNVPIVGNLLGTRKRLAMAMGVEEADLAEAYTVRRENPISPKIVETGPVQDNVLVDKVNIRRIIPVLRDHEKDVGLYITTGLVTAKDPDTDIRGMGIHRILVKGENRFGIFLDTPLLRDFFSWFPSINGLFAQYLRQSAGFLVRRTICTPPRNPLICPRFARTPHPPDGSPAFLILHKNSHLWIGNSLVPQN